jgi:hypothetical protein
MGTCHASKIYDLTNMATDDVKWRVLHGIQSFAKFCGQMPRIATTGITSWQTALKWTADCQVPQGLSRSSQACGNLLSNSYFCLWQST